VTPSSELTAIRAVRGAFGNTHARGRTHTTYQGISTGPNSMSSSNAQPQVAACSRGIITGAHARSVPVVRRHTVRASRQMATARMTAATTRTTQPIVWNVTTSSRRAPTAAGASHPSCPASSSMPSVGSCHWKNGAANAAVINAARPTWVMPTRQRSSGLRRAMHHTSSSNNGRPAVALIKAPIVSSAIAGISLCETTRANALAIMSATNRSLCPLATAWNTTTGFAPNATSAKAVRSGQRRRTVHTITAQVARLASRAIIRYASTCASGRARSQVESHPDSEDHTGP